MIKIWSTNYKRIKILIETETKLIKNFWIKTIFLIEIDFKLNVQFFWEVSVNFVI